MKENAAPQGKSAGEKVPFFALFSYADSQDVALMILGSLGACIHGAALPLFFLFFGSLINSLAAADLSSATQVHLHARLELLPGPLCLPIFSVGRRSVVELSARPPCLLQTRRKQNVQRVPGRLGIMRRVSARSVDGT